MLSLETLVGLSAAILTTAANVSQAKKAWKTRTADDLSLKMLVILISGIALWCFYGVLKKDYVIIVANCASIALLSLILYVKLGYSKSEAGGERSTRRAKTRGGVT